MKFQSTKYLKDLNFKNNPKNCSLDVFLSSPSCRRPCPFPGVTIETIL
jgi:hypothetical protein